jgi:hypothetical protein
MQESDNPSTRIADAIRPLRALGEVEEDWTAGQSASFHAVERPGNACTARLNG